MRRRPGPGVDSLLPWLVPEVAEAVDEDSRWSWVDNRAVTFFTVTGDGTMLNE